MRITALIIVLLALVVTAGCIPEAKNTVAPESNSGARMHKVKVALNEEGLTTEQVNIAAKLDSDNVPGAVQHLYVVSSYSGQCLLYSTVVGKVTSSGKRLTPTSVVGTDGQYVDKESRGIKVKIGGKVYYTTEVPQDDGTFGNSIPYLFWKDVRGVDHRHYISGGQYVHVSTQPIPMKNIVLNIETLAIKKQ